MSSSDGTCGLSATSRQSRGHGGGRDRLADLSSAVAGATVTCHGRPTRSERDAGHVRKGRQGRLDALRKVLPLVLVELDLDHRLILHEPRGELLGRSLADEPAGGPEDADPVRTPTGTCESRWLDRRIVRPLSRLRDWSSSRISWTPIGSIAVRVGSSRIRMSGSFTRASAMPSRWRMPREYVLTLSLPRSVRPAWRRDLVDRLLRGLAVQPVEARRVAQVRAARHVVVEADRIRQVADPAFDLTRITRRVEPDTRASPSVGSVSPSSIRIVVVLPAPFCPSSPKILTTAHLEVKAVDRGEVAVLLGQAARHQRRGRRRVRWRRGPGLRRRQRRSSPAVPAKT